MVTKDGFSVYNFHAELKLTFIIDIIRGAELEENQNYSHVRFSWL